MTDILIAGGGLAGSAAAIHLGKLGFSVELFERGRFPKEKACGEGLMPAGVAALERLGLDTSTGAPFHGIRYHLGLRIAEGRFPESDGFPGSGRGLRRRQLDRALFQLAAQTPNVKVHAGALVQTPWVEKGRIAGLIVNGELYRGGLVVAADGAQSRLRHLLRLDLPPRRKRVGVCMHFRLAPGSAPTQIVDVYLGRGYELYATPLPNHELVVAGAARTTCIEGSLEEQFRRWCSTHLAERLEGAEQISDLLAISPVSGRARRRFLPGFVLLGDAAGFTDPITGGGMTQALLTAELFANHATRHAPTADHWLAAFDREREALLQDYRRLTALLLWLALNPVLFGVALAGMRRLPPLFTHLLGVAGGTRRLWSADLRHHIPTLALRHDLPAETP